MDFDSVDLLGACAIKALKAEHVMFLNANVKLIL